MTHDEFHNQMSAFLAGGLTDAERAGFMAHAAGCPACAAALEQAETADRELEELFAAARPDRGLEDRVVARLRAVKRPPMVLHPMVRRAAIGVAATILLGGVGFAVTQAEKRGVPVVAVAPAGANAKPSMGSGLGDNRSAHTSYFAHVSNVETPTQMATRFAASAA